MIRSVQFIIHLIRTKWGGAPCGHIYTFPTHLWKNAFLYYSSPQLQDQGRRKVPRSGAGI